MPQYESAGSNASAAGTDRGVIAPFNERLSLSPTLNAVTKKVASVSKASAAAAKGSTATGSSKEAAISAAKQPATRSRHVSSSKSQPASRHAADSVTAAEAAVTAATAVMTVHKEPKTTAASKAQSAAVQLQHPRQTGQQRALQQQQQQEQQEQVHLHQSVLDDLQEPMHVHGVHAQPIDQLSSKAARLSRTGTGVMCSVAGSVATSQAGTPTALPSQSGTPGPGAGTALQRVQSLQQHPPQRCAPSHFLLLQHTGVLAAQSSSEPSAAALLAARAMSRRLKLQQRQLTGPPAFQRSLPQPRPYSPPPRALDGTLLLKSCPEAILPADVVQADLSSSGISHIALTVTQLAATGAQAAAGADAATQGTITGQIAAEATVVTLDKPGTASAATAAQHTSPGLSDFISLVHLDVSDNYLSSIGNLAYLPALQQLIVSANRVRTLHDLAQVLQVGPEQQASQQQQQQGVGSAADQLPVHQQQHKDAGTHRSQQRALMSAAEQHAAAADSIIGQQQRSDSIQQNLCCPGCFGHLQVLDISYNMLSGEQLLGVASPLAYLARLCVLQAAGNSLVSLPAVLGPFTHLSKLDLSFNKLKQDALVPLGQLPALQHLHLAQNPIRAVPDAIITAAAVAVAASKLQHPKGQQQLETAALTEAMCSRFSQLSLLDLCGSKVAKAEQLYPLLQLPQMAELHLAATPLAASWRADGGVLQGLQKAGLSIIMHQEQQPQEGVQAQTVLSSSKHASRRQQYQWQQKGKQHSITGSGSVAGRLLPVTIEEDPTAKHVLAAAAKSGMLAQLPHQQLVAVFDRVGAGIDSWQHLAPVAEESSIADSELAEDRAAAAGPQPQSDAAGQAGGGAAAEHEAYQDNTFLTGVGITGKLPEGENEDQTPGSTPAEEAFMDPTERLAVALGLQVTQLAHYTGRNPGNPDGAIHRLRHALAHPLVDPKAGERPQQHHGTLTAAALAKQRPRQLLPLPQPIPVTLGTCVAPVQGLSSMLQDMRGKLQALEGTLLQ